MAREQEGEREGQADCHKLIEDKRLVRPGELNVPDDLTPPSRLLQEKAKESCPGRVVRSLSS